MSITNCIMNKYIRDVPIPKFEPIPILNFKARPIATDTVPIPIFGFFSSKTVFCKAWK